MENEIEKQPLPPVLKKRGGHYLGENGRKSKYRRWMCRLALELFKKGYSRHQVAAQLGISYPSFLSYIQNFERFAQAVALGETYSQARWENEGMKAFEERELDFPLKLWETQVRNRFRDYGQQNLNVNIEGEVRNLNYNVIEDMRNQPDSYYAEIINILMQGGLWDSKIRELAGEQIQQARLEIAEEKIPDEVRIDESPEIVEQGKIRNMADHLRQRIIDGSFQPFTPR